MTKLLQIYKCAICGNIVEVVHPGGGQLVCCGQPMDLQKENTTDGALEKHVPVIVKVKGGVEVKVGSVAHPMTSEHYIEWIEIVCADGCCSSRVFLKPGDEPKAVLKTDCQEISAREYCNLHGLWKA